jgi:hypothetical protein
MKRRSAEHRPPPNEVRAPRRVPRHVEITTSVRWDSRLPNAKPIDILGRLRLVSDGVQAKRRNAVPAGSIDEGLDGRDHDGTDGNPS